METLKAVARDGCGPGLVRLTGSFTTDTSGVIKLARPSKSNVTIARNGTTAGAYTLVYVQPALSVVSSMAAVGPNSNIVGNGSVGFITANPGYAVISSDFMTGDGSGHYKADTTNTTLLITVFAAANNALAEVYALGNTSSLANYRVSYDVVLATSTMNQ